MSVGLDLENRIIEELKILGCEIKVNHDLDRDYKVDFLITSFPKTIWQRPVCVQLSSNIGDIEKAWEFMRTALTWKVSDKNVYLEVDPSVDVQKVAMPILACIMAYTLVEPSVSRSKVVRIVVKPNGISMFYKFNNPHEILDTGLLISYKSETGYGFIKSDRDSTSVYVHITNCSTELANMLQQTDILPTELGNRVRVVYQRVAPDPVSKHPYPKALKVEIFNSATHRHLLPKADLSSEENVYKPALTQVTPE